MKPRMRKTESGQALVIVLLVMAVGLTMGLSVISRSVTDIRISQQEAESARAFSAAEAGIERTLIGESLPSFEGINVSIKPISQGGGAEFDFGGDNKFAAGDTKTVWLIEHISEDKLGGDSLLPTAIIDVCWGSDPANKSAVEASVIYQSSDGFKLARGAYDADFGRGNNFDSPDPSGCLGLAFGKKIKLASDFSIPGDATLYALRLKLLYNSQTEPLAVKVSGGSLPAQGTCYESTATVTQTGVSRKVRQCQFYKTPPAIFDYGLYSGGNLVK